MNPRRRPRDVIEAIEAIAAQQGMIEAVDADYYRDFLGLSQRQIENLAVAIMLEHEGEVRRLATQAETDAGVTKVATFVHATMTAIGIGLERFDVFGRLVFVSRIGPEPFDVDLSEEMEKRMQEITPIVANIVRRSLPWLLSREMSQGELGL